jgi:hypothetical protein
MSFIKTDYSKNKESEFTPVPTDNYEMIIQSAQERATKNGAESLQLRLIIRNDLDGVSENQKKYHNRNIFMDNWKRKATNQYDMQGFQYILDACKIPEGTDIPNVQGFIDTISGKPVKVYITKDTDEYNGKEREVNHIAPWNIKTTDYPDVQHKFKTKDKANDPFADNSKPVDISDKDLPF